jgi:VanZ family protein
VRDARLAGRLALAWAGVVLVFAVVPTHEVLSSTVGDGETVTTQIGHFTEFAVLAWLVASWADARTASGWHALAFAWAVAVVYGGLIEVLQAPLSYRSAQWSDLAIDAAGAVAGLVVFRAVRGSGAPEARRRVR